MTQSLSPHLLPKTIVVVLGMHRSGTSAVTGALSRLGMSLGGRLVPAAPDNPLGYFENADAVEINETLLLELGRGWDDLRPLPEGWRASAAADAARQRIATWLRHEVPGAETVVLKDPRLCLSFPLWREVFEANGVAVRVVLAHRRLSEVVASLMARDALAPRHALLLALQHVLLAEQSSRGLKRTGSHYDALMAAPAIELTRVLDALQLSSPPVEDLARAVAGFDSQQRHHRHSEAVAGSEDLSEICAAVEVFARSSGVPESLPEAYLAAVMQAAADEAPRLQPDADRLSRARLTAQTFAARIRQLADALASAEALASERLEAQRMLDQRLLSMDAALEASTRRNADALASIQALRPALAHAEQLALERLETSAALDRALADVTGLAVSRLETMRALDARVLETEALLTSSRLEARALASDLSRLQEQVTWMQSSWSWRLTRPLRVIARWLGRASP